MDLGEPGLRFKPTDEFLLRVLVRLATGLSVDILSPHIVELDLYGPGKEPWKLFSGDQEILELYNVADPERRVREKYIFTKVSRIGGKTNVSRTAGDGTWLDKSKTTDVKIGDCVIGHHKTLTYEYCGGDGAAQGRSYHYLHEFQLSGQVLQQLQMSRFDCVVCRVLKDTSKACRIGGKKRKLDCPPPAPTAPKRSCLRDISMPSAQFQTDREMESGVVVVLDGDDVTSCVSQAQQPTTDDMNEVSSFPIQGEQTIGVSDYLDPDMDFTLDSEFLETVISIMNS